MKKFRLLLLPLILLMTGCKEGQGFEIGYSDGDNHSAGPDREGSSKNNGPISYSYMNNASLDNTGLNKTTLTFEGITTSESDIQDETKLMDYLIDDQHILTGIDNPHNVSTKANGQFFIGADSAYVDGMITLYFSSNIKNIEITAKPYYYISGAYNEEEIYLDHEVAISINNGGYIKLKEEVDQDTKEVTSSTLSYHLDEPAGAITIKVGKRRAIFEKIDLYY